MSNSNQLSSFIRNGQFDNNQNSSDNEVANLNYKSEKRGKGSLGKYYELNKENIDRVGQELQMSDEEDDSDIDGVPLDAMPEASEQSTDPNLIGPPAPKKAKGPTQLDSIITSYKLKSGKDQEFSTGTHHGSYIEPDQSLENFTRLMHDQQKKIKDEKATKEELLQASAMSKELEYLKENNINQENGSERSPKQKEEDFADDESETIDYDNLDLSAVEMSLRILLKGNEAGQIIGADGASLGNIRTVSGAKVIIDNPEDYEHIKEQKLIDGKELRKCCERIMTIKGNPEQLNTALGLGILL